MLVPLANCWDDPRLFDCLKANLVIMPKNVCPISLSLALLPLADNPFQVYPDLVDWTTMGVTCMIEKVWYAQQITLQKGKQVSPYIVELMSVLERTLNVAHTGNVSVIATSLMNPLWVGHSLVSHGTPTFHPCLNMAHTSTDAVYIPEAKWPQNKDTGQPCTSSRCSQVFNYGIAQWEVCNPNHHPAHVRPTRLFHFV